MLVELLREIIVGLESKEIEYMISGSLAMSTYTMPRMTRDIDIVIELDIEQLDDFLQLFQSNFYTHRPSMEEEIRKKGMFNVIDHRSGYKVDFVLRKNSLYRKLEFQRKIRSNVLGIEAWLVTIEDLILSKLIWIQDVQSDQQKSDIKNLLENSAIDFSYVNRWIKELNLNTFNLV
jgi:hypothetical protein